MGKRTLILVACVALLVAVLALPAAATPSQDFYMEKTCDDVSCVITYAEGPFASLLGETIVYEDRVFGENPAGHFIEIARITVDDGEGTTLTGQIRWLTDAGMFTISRGTGDMKGVHAIGDIEYVGEVGGLFVYSLEGTYHFEGR